MCTRCNKPTNVTTMSRFNTQIICMSCEEIERKHPRYKEATDAEFQACMRGSRNFPGIGLPTDLA